MRRLLWLLCPWRSAAGAPSRAGYPLRRIDCDNSPEIAGLFGTYAAEGFKVSTSVANHALQLYDIMQFDQPWLQILVDWFQVPGADDFFHAGQGADDFARGYTAYGQHVQQNFAMILCDYQEQYGKFCEVDLANEFAQLRDDEEGFCPYEFGPYTVLMQRFFLLIGVRSAARAAKLTGRGIEVEMHFMYKLVTELRQAMFDMLVLPFHTHDFLESSRWNISSFTLAANLIDDSLGSYTTYEDYVAASPVPQPLRRPWVLDFLGPQRFHSEAGGVRLLGHAAERLAGAETSVTVVILEEHDATAWDDWQTLRTALISLASGFVGVDVRFALTTVKGLKSCPDGDTMESMLSLGLDYKVFRSLLSDVLPGGAVLNLADMQRWLSETWRGDSFLRRADVVLCGEPPFLCPLLIDAFAQDPRLSATTATLWRFNMGLLLWFPFGSEDLWAFWGLFYRALPAAVPSISNRYVVEQVAEQTGVRFPYVPWTGMWAETSCRRGRQRRQDFLLFHGTKQPHYSWRLALLLFLKQDENRDLSFYDMNEQQQLTEEAHDDIPGFFGLCRADMGNFRAAVLLPHNPAPTRLIDLYSQLVPVFVLAEPAVHKYMWTNGAFGGLDSPEVMLEVAPPHLRDDARHATADVPPTHPPFSALDYLRKRVNYFTFADMEAKRYWYQYTEFALMPGLQGFQSFPDLFDRLRRLDQEVESIKEVMSAHLQARRVDALGWWRTALSIALARI